MPRLLLGSLVILASLAAAETLRAQAISNWEFNVHAATLRENLFEETGNGLAAGARLTKNTRSGLAFGGNFDWVRRGNVDLGPAFVGQEPSLTMLLYSAGIDYVFPAAGRARFFLGGGFGAATTMLSGITDNSIAESSTGALIPFGLGFKIYNRPVDPTWAIRIDARDNIIMVNTVQPGGAEEQTEPRHNLEVSAGFSFAFGGGPRAAAGGRPAPARPAPGRPAADDQDQDGVPDDQDDCPSTPRGVRIDALGCPVPGAGRPTPARPPVANDTDSDGITDVDDRCVNTPAGVSVDERGCPAGAEPPAEDGLDEELPADQPPGEPGIPAGLCLDNREWFSTDAPIRFEDRSWKKLGIPEPISTENLKRVGAVDGVPVFVSAFSTQPYQDLWLPLCLPSGSFQLYIPGP